MLEPVTAHPWTNVAEHTGGVLWEANAFDGDDVATARRVFEELARPVRLRDLRIAAADIELADVPETLDEGTAYQRLLLHASEVERLEVVGRAWSETVRRRVRPDETFGKRWSALLFGTDLVSELDEREMMVFAVEGGAVSPVTSYLAIEPGVRPSTEGLDWEGSMGFGAGGLGLMGTGSGAGGGVIRNQFDHEAWLADNLRSKVETCAGASRSAKVTLETTLDEIVDIRAVKVDGDDGQELARCVETAMWNLALPGDFDAAFRTFMVDV